MILEFLTLFGTFFVIGAFTIGGGYAMIPLIQQIVVDQGWMSLPDLIDFIAIAESTPGPIAINLATFIGMHKEGIIGALGCTIGVVLPSFIIILFVAKYYLKYKNNYYVSSALTGVRPAVIGLLGAAIVSIGISTFVLSTEGSFTDMVNVRGIIIFALLLPIVLKFKKLHPIYVVLISAGLGILLFGAF